MISQAQRRLELGYWQEALQLLEKAAREATAESERVTAYLEMGKLHHVLAQHEQAVQVLSQAVQLSPEHAQAHYLLGRAYCSQERWQQARAALEVADRLIPDDPAILDSYFAL